MAQWEVEDVKDGLVDVEEHQGNFGEPLEQLGQEEEEGQDHLPLIMRLWSLWNVLWWLIVIVVSSCNVHPVKGKSKNVYYEC